MKTDEAAYLEMKLSSLREALVVMDSKSEPYKATQREIQATELELRALIGPG